VQADISSLQVSFWRTGNGKEAAKMLTIEGQSKVRVGKSGIGGCGVFARQALGREEVVGQVVGTVITDPDYSSRTCIDLGHSRSLETTSPFRYLNHACDPNCEFFQWDEPRDLLQVWLQTVRPIDAGEELAIDYAWHADAAIRCFCGSPTCRGWIVDTRELRLLGSVQA
jgi:hypothetical protein